LKREDYQWITATQRETVKTASTGTHFHQTTLKNEVRAGHNKENIDWICNFPSCMCHDKRDNLGDPMGKKDKKNKANWEKDHACIKCKKIVSSLICPDCGKLSVKI